MKLIILAIGLLGFISCTQQNKSTNSYFADTIYFGGDIITMEGDTATYAEAIAVNDGNIVFVGTKAEAENFKGDSTLMQNLHGKTLLPGFLDAHSHYINSLLVANQCKLYPPPSGPAKDVESKNAVQFLLVSIKIVKQAVSQLVIMN